MAGIITADLSSITSGLTEFVNRLKSFQTSFLADVETSVESALQDGEQAMHQRVQAAVTKTGVEREADDGGLPGRIVTGALDDGITHQVAHDQNSITGYLGWIGPVAKYDLYQEYGTGENFNGDLQDPSFGSSEPGAGVPHMHALIDGFMVAKASLEDSFKDLDGKVFSA